MSVLSLKEKYAAMDFFEKKKDTANSNQAAILDEVISFVDLLAAGDYDKADAVIQEIMKKGQDGLFQEVGKVTRKLHDSIKTFKDALAPTLGMTWTAMPNAIDQLYFVIEKTEDAANKTMGIAEKYLQTGDDLSMHINKVTGPVESIEYLKSFKDGIDNDMTEVMTTQSFQDLTGQAIKKVIGLVGDIEGELVKMIASFGVKMDSEQPKVEVGVASILTGQTDVDDLLAEFGF